MKQCPVCSTEFEEKSKWGDVRKTCSMSCAGKIHPKRTEESKLKTSKSLKSWFDKLDENQKKERKKEKRKGQLNRKKQYVGPYTSIKLGNCTHCKKQFWRNNEHTVRFNTTCSDECFLAVKRKNASGNKTTYKNEKYDSEWEVKLANWMNNNGIVFEKPKQHIPWTDNTGKKRKYFPDFYIPTLDLYLDPKNPICIKQQKEKLDTVSKQIKLIYGDIDYIIQYLNK